MKKAENKTKTYRTIIFALVIISATVFFTTLIIRNLVSESPLVVSASTDERVRAAEERVRAAEEERRRLQAEREAIERDRSNLEEHQGNLRVMLANLNAEMASVVAHIAQLEFEIENKILDIEQAELDLAEAIRVKDQQYADMKERIKFTYERQDFVLLETLISASNLSEFLNYADYFEQLAGYDQMKLDEYHEIERLVDAYKNILEDEKEALDLFLLSVEAEQTRVSELISRANINISYTNTQILEAEQNILAREAEQKAKEAELEQLQKDLAEEMRLRELARQRAWRNISDLHFDESDRYLLANLIFCEAGGERYEGQVAVGAVVINRMMSSVFPNTMVGVIYQSRQFSPVASGRLALALAENRATASCYRAADEAMQGVTPVGNSLFFRTPIPGLEGQVIGGHVFY
ncbi:MAG: cell wall hydrolase [Lachnospiraceae bacterium]|nr:cell wall hydrolase [Lachnospiraceae bacterium]